jgi:MATE family multidrug resistance protein
MHHIGLSADLADGSTPVLRLFALSLIPILIADTGVFWLEAHGHPVRGMVAMWGANAVNLALNLWLVPGTSPFAIEGATASAWATLGARVALLGFVAALIIGWSRSRGLGVFDKAPRDPAAAAEMRRVGYGASVSHFVETSAFAGMSIYAGWLGVTAVATWAIVLNVAALIFMVPLGLAVATSVLVGRSWGADDLPAVRRAGTLGFSATLAVTLVICAVVGFGADRIAAAYTLDPAVRAATTAALLLSCLFFVADGLQVVAAQSLRARGDVWVPSLTHAISYSMVMLPLGYYLALPAGLGVPGIVWAVIIASLCAAGLLLTRFYWTARGLHHG